jgi:DNA-binding response OmpR family regulator
MNADATFGLTPKIRSLPTRSQVFVVTDHAIASRWLLSLFSDPSFNVTLATSFAEAKSLLLDRPPAMIVAAVQLGEYNGLGLVLRAKSANPQVRAVVLSRAPDPVLQADAETLGATFVSLPIEVRELRAAIIRTLFRENVTAAVDPIRAPFERRRAGMAAPHQVATEAAPARLGRDGLFPIPMPAMLHFDLPRAEG